MNLRLEVALNDVTGKSGRAIIEAILSGERNPKSLAELADRSRSRHGPRTTPSRPQPTAGPPHTDVTTKNTPKRKARRPDADENLVKALSHPLRWQILRMINEGTSTPAGIARRIGVRAATPAGAEVLTSREREVLRLVAEGHSNGRIAERLFISPKTASVHVSRIIAKLDVGNRVEAAAVGRRLGLLD